VKSIKTSLLLATLLVSSVAFAADGPAANTTVQLNENAYDLSTKKEVESSSVFHAQSNRGFQRIIYSVEARAAAPVLVVEEAGTKVTRVVEGVRYDVVEKQNAFQYKYKPR
jgi:hypothetical protein